MEPSNTEPSEDPLERWSDAGLITDEQRAEIERYEESRPPPNGHHILVAEMLVFVGIAALLAAVPTILQHSSAGTRGFILIGLTIATGWAGGELLATETRTLARPAQILWLLSVVFAAGVGMNFSGQGGHGVVRPLLFAGLPSFVAASVYWSILRSGLQLLGAYATGLLVVFGIVNAIAPLTVTTGGLLVASIGIAALGATTRGWIGPLHAADALFGFSTTIGLFIASVRPVGAVFEVAAVLAALGLMWLSIEWRSSDLMAVGSLSLIVFAIAEMERHFSGGLAAPVSFLFGGAALIARSIFVSHTRSGPPAPHH
jgi:hypothetical protein